MSATLHVIYRAVPTMDGGERWESYSYPVPIHVVGDGLAETRAALRDAARFAFDDFDPATSRVQEHIERPIDDGVFVRTAIDRRTLDRDQVRATMSGVLTRPAQRRHLEQTGHLAATGDLVVVACVAADTIGWVVEQMSEDEALIVAVQAADMGVWTSFLAGMRSDAATDPTNTEPIGEAGLQLTSTLSEFMQADSTSSGRLVAAGTR